MVDIRSPNLPLGTTIGEFIGHEIVGSTRTTKRFAYASVLGSIESRIGVVETAVSNNTGGISNAGLTTYGYQAGINNGTPTSTPSHSADLNTFIGSGAGQANTTGFAHAFLGAGAGSANTTGDSNTYIGAQAGITGTTAKWNVAIGVDALFANITGINNVVIGHHAGILLAFAAGAGEIVAIGAEVMKGGVGATKTVAIGYRSGYNINASGTGSTMVGHLSGFTTTSGLNNTFIGQAAGFTNATGQSNIFLGAFAGYYETGSSKFIVGNDTYANEAAARLANIIYGEMNSTLASQYLQVNGGFVVADGAVPTGGQKGPGTINAKDVYNDNVALTCFGIEYLIDGKVDVAKWDGFLPEGRENSLVRKFVALTEKFDPRDPAQYLDYMRSTRSLPGMPTQDDWQHNALGMGELTSQLWLSAELLGSAFAGHVANTNELARRVSALESRLAA